MMKVKDTYF